MGKHAYLVLAHNQKKLLIELLKAIDDSRNDIFLHIDKKSDMDLEDLRKYVKNSRCYFIERFSIGWGGQSLIQVTLRLLKKSTQIENYDYYHFISGQDFPLKSQEEIHHFFDNHRGLEFISCKPMEPMYDDRIRYYYYFQDVFGGRTLFNKIAKKMSVYVQKILKIDRIKKKSIRYGIGAQWFSITDRMARYVITQQQFIEENFYKCFCADEIFLQTLWLNAPFYTEKLKYHSNKTQDSNIEEIYYDVVRAIDWKRGTPYTYDETDYDMLINSGCLFARKMSEEKSMKLIEMIKESYKKQ